MLKEDLVVNLVLIDCLDGPNLIERCAFQVVLLDYRFLKYKFYSKTSQNFLAISIFNSNIPNSGVFSFQSKSAPVFSSVKYPTGGKKLSTKSEIER